MGPRPRQDGASGMGLGFWSAGLLIIFKRVNQLGAGQETHPLSMAPAPRLADGAELGLGVRVNAKAQPPSQPKAELSGEQGKIASAKTDGPDPPLTCGTWLKVRSKLLPGSRCQGPAHAQPPGRDSTGCRLFIQPPWPYSSPLRPGHGAGQGWHP